MSTTTEISPKKKLEGLKKMVKQAFELGAKEVTLHCLEIGSTRDKPYTTKIRAAGDFDKAPIPYSVVTGIAFDL